MEHIRNPLLLLNLTFQPSLKSWIKTSISSGSRDWYSVRIPYTYMSMSRANLTNETNLLGFHHPISICLQCSRLEIDTWKHWILFPFWNFSHWRSLFVSPPFMFDFFNIFGGVSGLHKKDMRIKKKLDGVKWSNVVTSELPSASSASTTQQGH